MTVLPGGSTGGLINKMLYGANPIPLNQGDFDNKPHATAAALTARSKVPSGILIRADDIWRHSKQTIPSHIQQLYTPQATFDRQLAASRLLQHFQITSCEHIKRSLGGHNG